MALHQAVVAVAAMKAEQPGAIDGHDELAQQPGGVESLHAHQPPHHFGAHTGETLGLDVPDEVVERVVDGAGVVVRASQAVEVVQHVGVMGIEFVVELTPTAELKQVQTDAPPSHEAGLVGNGLGVAAIGKLL